MSTWSSFRENKIIMCNLIRWCGGGAHCRQLVPSHFPSQPLLHSISEHKDHPLLADICFSVSLNVSLNISIAFDRHFLTCARCNPLLLYIQILPWLCLWLNSLSQRRADAIVSSLWLPPNGMRLEIPILAQAPCSYAASMSHDMQWDETKG